MYNRGVQQPAETVRINGVGYLTHNKQRVPEPQPAFQTPQPAGRPADYNQQYPPLGGMGQRAPRWDISYQKNKGLFVFNATSDGYADWSAEVCNHLNRTNREWTTLLEWVQVQPTDAETSYPALMRATMGGTSAWELANTLFGC